MSASQDSLLTATALQLLGTLELYRSDLDRVANSRFDPELYQEVSARVDQMRLYAATMPEVSVAWVELLIRHFELAHGLWRLGQGAADAAEIDRLRRSQHEAVNVLRERVEFVLRRQVA